MAPVQPRPSAGGMAPRARAPWVAACLDASGEAPLSWSACLAREAFIDTTGGGNIADIQIGLWWEQAHASF